ncbi:MAG TPA: Ig-like domain-containing protein [Mycobacterium sp.]|uniref:Ig-like domain-containing protein n=1 Tax=Mycolicibacterium sp. TaxID=2320850 RepID=UPI0025D4F2D3|nr:Ig-like domain-containing protein [Mycolicibacterium sp.]HPX37998.1 Ig-like domain-containing protein [Mycobacterium sp.]HQC77928.1 Ig-like domain-containing protein [Mycobacterium sp.]
MTVSGCVERIGHLAGPLAAAVGIGAAVFVGGTGDAVADAGNADSVDSVVSTATRSGAHRTVQSAAAAPASARRAAHGAPRPARSSARGADRTAAAAAPGILGGLGSVLNNRTPALAPTQIGQSIAGLVSGQLNATDDDGDALSYTVTSAPVHGTVSVAVDGGYSYTPDPAVAVTGTTDSFSVAVSDAGSGFHLHGLTGLLNLLTFGLLGSAGHTSIRTVAVTVAPFATSSGDNNAPTGTVRVNGADPVTGVVTGSVLGTDADGDPLTYSAPASTPKGNVSVESSTGAFSYTPSVTARQNAAASGATAADRQDAFTVAVSDGRGGTAAVVVTVPVTPSSSEPAATLAAFPGAEGFGAYATGGRGGSVIYVTNLNANGPGSLQWAIDQPGAKYVLFKVSGLIDTQIHLTNGNVTIAGQTSPGGITIRGLVTDESPYQDQAVQAPADFAENWILQHIRIRPGLTAPGDDGLRLRYTRNAIVDHVSIGNALDEAIEISYSHDITVQNTMLAETVGGHSFYGGVLMNYSNPAYGFGLDNVSLHHNIFNRIEGRLPEGSRESLAAANSYMNLELSNNLYWDPRFMVELGQSTGVVTNGAGEPYPIYWNLNAVNNYFQTSAAFPYSMFDDLILRRSGNNLYVSGNKMNLYPARSDYQLFYCCNDYSSVTDPGGSAGLAHQLATRNAFPAITYTPTDQLRTVLLDTAGAWPRDPMDTRLLGFVAANTFSGAPPNTNPAGDGLLPAYTGAAPAAPADTDSDGMPDSWEVANGLNPNSANANGTHLSSAGYTDLEVYLHELSDSRITGWP